MNSLCIEMLSQQTGATRSLWFLDSKFHLGLCPLELRLFDFAI